MTMKMNKNIIISPIATTVIGIMAVVLSCSMLFPTSCHAAGKKTIVVNDFATLRYAYGLENVISNMIISELTGSGIFTVLEKKNFDDIKREQADCLTGIYSKTNCPQVGKAHGAEIQLFGVLAEIGIEQKDMNVGSYLKNSNFTNLKRRVVTARVKIDIRIVDGTTRGILLATSGMGAETDKDWQGVGSFDNVFSHIEIGNREWEQSFVGKAVRRAVQDVVRQIVSQVGNGGASTREGFVTAVSGNYVYINLGAAHGLQKGMKVTISKSKDVFNSSGAIVFRGKEAVAVILISEVHNEASQGKIIERIDPVTEGYLAEIQN